MPNEHRIKWTEVVSVAGSIASITGISLLWLRDRIDPGTAFVTVPLFALTASIGQGFSALAYRAFMHGYDRWARNAETSVKVAYVSLAAPHLALVVAGGIGVVIKAFALLSRF